MLVLSISFSSMLFIRKQEYLRHNTSSLVSLLPVPPILCPALQHLSTRRTNALHQFPIALSLIFEPPCFFFEINGRKATGKLHSDEYVIENKIARSMAAI